MGLQGSFTKFPFYLWLLEAGATRHTTKDRIGPSRLGVHCGEEQCQVGAIGGPTTAHQSGPNETICHSFR